MESTQFSVTHVSALDTHLANPTVGGKLATQVYRPESDRELASLLGEANREGMAVVPLGGGTHLGVGNAPSRVDWIVSTRNLNRVIAYEPPDMTLSVEAGATLGEVQERLAEHGQGLPIEVANPAQATIGGILATALYGPKRLGSGTLRDYLIGVNVAYADGTLAKAGGMVVKNVSGFDLMRMHHGALGTLGVIVSANFKVLPNPRSERTVLIAASDFDEVTRLQSVIASSRSRPASFEIIRRAGAFDVAVRIQGRDRTAGLLASELGGICGGEARIQEPGESHQFWSEYLAGFQSSEAVTTCWLRLRVKPAETLRALADVLLALEERSAADAQVSASPGLGFVDVRQHLGSAEDLRDLTGRLRTLAPKTVVISAPTDLKADIDVWGESIESLDLMRILKTEFDPSGILNPGRFVGGL